MVLDTKMIERVKELREKGLSFREISRVVERNLSNVHRWYKLGAGKIKPKKTGRPSMDRRS